jgi:nitrite reductase/ring-hydroxylating ferredoxin subunit
VSGVASDAGAAAGNWAPIEGVDPATATFPLRARINGEDLIVIRVGDGLRAVQRTCPHQRASLGDAHVVNDGRMLRCAMHGYTFRLADGKGVNCPGYRIKVYDVANESGRLLVRVG